MRRLASGKAASCRGAFVSDGEREQVIDFVNEATPEYGLMRSSARSEKAAAGKDAPEEKDEDGHSAALDDIRSAAIGLLPQAVDVILDTKQASVSMLQRRLKLGYSRAASG